MTGLKMKIIKENELNAFYISQVYPILHIVFYSFKHDILHLAFLSKCI